MPLHVGNYRLGQMYRAHQVEVNGSMPFGRSDGQKILGWRPSGIGYAYVDPPKPLRHLLGKALDGVRVRHVQSFSVNLGAGLAAKFVGGLDESLFRASAHRNLGAFAGKSYSGRQPNALAGCGDDYAPAFQSQIHSIPPDYFMSSRYSCRV